jgi:hypothetical protein
LAALVSFYCTCRTPLSAAIGTPAVVCHQCGQTVGVPYSPPPPAQLLPTAPNVPSAARPLTAIIRMVLGAALVAAGKMKGRDAEELIAAGQKFEGYLIILTIPLGIAFILAGFIELVFKKRIGLFGRE